MLRRTLVLAAILLVAGWSLSEAQMMGQGGTMMHGNSTSTSNYGNSSWMGRGMMGTGMMGNSRMGYGMMGAEMMDMMYGGMPSFAYLVNLGLNDRQIDKILDLGNNLAKKQVSHYRQLASLQHELLQAKNQVNFDPQRVKDLTVKIASLSADLQVGQAKTNQKAMDILTEQQRSKLIDPSYPLISSAYCPLLGYGMGMSGYGE